MAVQESKTIVIDITNEIEKLKVKKENLIDKFVTECEEINAQIKYLRELQKIGGNNGTWKRNRRMDVLEWTISVM